MARQKRKDSGFFAESILFVAQSMRSMLDGRSFPSYRLRTIDLLASLDEAIDVALRVERAGVDRRNLSAVAEECLNLLKSDPIASEQYTNEIKAFSEVYKRCEKKEISLSDFAHSARHFSRIISADYHEKLKDFIINNYQVLGKRGEVIHALSCYFSHLVNSGYSEIYLLSEVNSRFFSNELKKVETRTLRRFLSKFDNKDHLYHNWTACNSHFSELIGGKGVDVCQAVKFRRAPQDVKDALKDSMRDGWEDLIFAKVRARDPYSSSQHFKSSVSKVRAFNAMARAHVPLADAGDVYVRPGSARQGVIVKRFANLFHDFVPDFDGEHAAIIRPKIDGIFENFSEESANRILNSLNSAYQAKMSSDNSGRIISIWTAFEVLIRNPPLGLNRILHYRDVIYPVACRYYAQESLLALLQYLINVDEDAVYRRVAEVPFETDDDVKKFAHLMVSEDLIELENNLFGDFAKSPLAQFRMHQFLDRFAKKKDYLKSLSAHEDRVGWQIERIYRARNSLVHAGQVPRYLSSLYRNASEYFRSLIIHLTDAAIEQGSVNDIDDVLAGISLDFNALKKGFESGVAQGDRFSKEEISRYFL